MLSDTLQRTAKAAFSSDEWAVLMAEPKIARSWKLLRTVEEVEEFILDAHEHLQAARKGASISTTLAAR